MHPPAPVSSTVYPSTTVASSTTSSPVQGIVSQTMQYSWLDAEMQQAIYQVSHLTPPPSNATKKQTCPTQFLQHLGIEAKPGKGFNAQDIEQIYEMMSAHPASNRMCFFTHFGLARFELLKTLDTLGASLGPEKREALMKRYYSWYMDTYNAFAISDEDDLPKMRSLNQTAKRQLIEFTVLLEKELKPDPQCKKKQGA